MRYLFVIFLLVSGCKKAENRHCFKFNGSQVVKEISLDYFDKLELHQHVEFVLVQDTINKVILKGGENLLNDISLTVLDNILTVKNNNKCNFLRRYDKVVKAEIHFINLLALDFRGTENVTNIGTLNSFWFKMVLIEGSGSVNLNLNTEIVNVYSASFTDFTFTGQAGQAEFTLTSNSFCDTYGLKLKKSLKIESSSLGLVKVNADKVELKAEINYGGNINYIGYPTNKILNKNGKGDLVDMN